MIEELMDQPTQAERKLIKNEFKGLDAVANMLFRCRASLLQATIYGKNKNLIENIDGFIVEERPIEQFIADLHSLLSQDIFRVILRSQL